MTKEFSRRSTSRRIWGPENQSVQGMLKADYELRTCAPAADSLTGLLAHGFFQMCLDREITRCSKQGEPVSLGLVDIDWFSFYNKRHSPLEGDLMLKAVASVIRKNIRDEDLAARYGGDTFAVLFVQSELPHAAAAPERIRGAVEKMSGGSLTVSIGIASLDGESASSGDALMERAKEALFHAKIRGKNRVYFFDKERPASGGVKRRVLVVDDDPLNLRFMEAMLLPSGYEVMKASSGEEALHLMGKVAVDLVLLDVLMPGMDGFEVCRRLKQSESTRLIPVVMLTALDGTEARVVGIEAGADDFISKPPNRTELLARTKSLINVKVLNDNLIGVENVLLSLAKTIEARDPYTEGHVERVANMAVALGRRMGLSSESLQALKLGGILHDIGKIRVPDHILNKTSPLDPEEVEIMKRHSDIGYGICLPLKRTLGEALDVVLHHHECMDGSGYPDSLSGQEIPLSVRIMTVVDIYDALITHRPYRQAMGREEALGFIRQMVLAGKLDPEVVRHLAEWLVSEEEAETDEP